MAEERLVLVSDVHLDQWEKDLPAEHAAKRARLLEFFDWLVTGSGAGRLLIAGDLIDVPQRDGGAILPRYDDVAAKLAQVMAAGIKVGYVTGNHDSGLVGLSVELDDPPLRIRYPSMVVRSGGRLIWVEHGHLHDPLLLEYVRTLGMAMFAPRTAPVGPFFLRPPGVAGGTSGTAAEPPVTVAGLWQRNAVEEFMHEPDVADRIAAVAQTDLAEDYGDVLDAGERELRAAQRQRLAGALGEALPAGVGSFGLTGFQPPSVREVLEELVQAVYSGPHWRRAAKRRLAEVSWQQDEPVTGAVMGHTHWPDELRWREDGAQRHYINAGSWRRESADIVVIDDGEMTLHRRTWQEPWPDLS